jgi:hypothetical protein
MLRVVLSELGVCGALTACAFAGCGDEPQHDPAPMQAQAREPSDVRVSTLAVQRRADGLEQVSLIGRLQHVTRVAAASDGGVHMHCTTPSAHAEASDP